MVIVIFGLTLKFAFAVASTAPAVALTTTAEAAPAADGVAVAGTVTELHEVIGVAPRVTLAGLNVAVAPVGRPVAVRVDGTREASLRRHGDRDVDLRGRGRLPASPCSARRSSVPAEVPGVAGAGGGVLAFGFTGSPSSSGVLGSCASLEPGAGIALPPRLRWIPVEELASPQPMTETVVSARTGSRATRRAFRMFSVCCKPDATSGSAKNHESSRCASAPLAQTAGQRPPRNPQNQAPSEESFTRSCAARASAWVAMDQSGNVAIHGACGLAPTPRGAAAPW